MPTITFLLTLCFVFVFFFVFSFLSFLLYLSLSCFVLSLFCARLGPFLYCLPCRIFTILPFNRFCPDVGVLPRPPTGLSAAQPSPFTYVGHATSHSYTKSLLLFSCSLWHSHPDKGGYSLSLSLMACT